MKISAPRILLHLEGLGVLAATCVLYSRLEYSWIRFAVFLLAPDLAMLGLLVNRELGVICYNSVHTYIAPLLLFCLFSALGQQQLYWIVLVWTAHIGMDRLCGYGLKYPADLKQSHLQRA
jgi:hypothetical protein